MSFPSDLGTGGLGTGAALTIAGYVGAQCPTGPARPACRARCRTRPAKRDPRPAPHLDQPGARRWPATSAKHPGDAYRPKVPAALVSFGESANFPLLLGAVLVLCGTAALAHLLVVSVSRPAQGERPAEDPRLRPPPGGDGCALAGHDSGDRRNRGRVPLGIAVRPGHMASLRHQPRGGGGPRGARLAYRGARGTAVLFAANAIAMVPALAASRSRPGQLLRTE